MTRSNWKPLYKGKQTIQVHQNMSIAKRIKHYQVSTYNGDSWLIDIVPIQELNNTKLDHLDRVFKKGESKEVTEAYNRFYR